jgi:hypothetical protein
MLDHFEEIEAHAGTNQLAVAIELVAARQQFFAMREEISEATAAVVALVPRLAVASHHCIASPPVAPPSTPRPLVEPEPGGTMSVASAGARG